MMAVKFFFVVRLAVCMNSPPWDLFSGQQPFPTNQHGFHGLLFIPCSTDYKTCVVWWYNRGVAFLRKPSCCRPKLSMLYTAV